MKISHERDETHGCSFISIGGPHDFIRKSGRLGVNGGCAETHDFIRKSGRLGVNGAHVFPIEQQILSPFKIDCRPLM